MRQPVSKTMPWWKPEIGPREYDLVKSVLESNYVNDGAVTEQFEAEIRFALIL